MFNNPLFVGASLSMYAYLFVKTSMQLDYAYTFYNEFPLASQIKTRTGTWPLIIFAYTCVCAGSGFMFIYTLNKAFG